MTTNPTPIINGTLPAANASLLPTDFSPVMPDTQIEFWFASSLTGGVLSAVYKNKTTGVTYSRTQFGGTAYQNANALVPGSLPIPQGYTVNFSYSVAGSGATYDLTVYDVPRVV